MRAIWCGRRELELVDYPWVLQPGNVYNIETFSHGGNGPIRVLIEGSTVMNYPQPSAFTLQWEVICDE